MSASPLAILKQYWGYDAFRPLQAEIIQSVLDGRDTLALLPTGGGKSICYQVPALCRDGIAIVVSPLIALMKDQVENLRKRGVAAAAIYSGMSRREIDIVFENAVNGGYKLLYLSPERLQTEMAQMRIARMQVNLLAVDESHCVSQWGYDFRPPYLQIADLQELLPNTPIMALTATATPEVVADIQEKLRFRKGAQVFQQSFVRDNLSYSVLYESNKREKMLDVFRNVGGSGLVYVRSRGETREIAQFLLQHRIAADFYHAGLSPEERSKKQEDWMQGRTRIMVCTNAFGMGIDKPDVRSVVHLSLPDSLEAYFQEAGRVGRDGKKAFAVLLYVPVDAEQLRFHFEASYPPMDLVRRVYQAIGSFTQIAIGAGKGESFNFDFPLFCSNYKLDIAPTHAAMRLLEQEGWITLSEAAAAPAQVWIHTTRENLYDYQLRNKQADRLTKVMLRAYPGVQQGLTDISEAVVAKYAEMPLETVIAALEAAQKADVLTYAPRKDKPQLTLTRERVAAENLTIQLEKFNFRKTRAFERVEAAIRYAENRQCRSKQLIAYFGEKAGAACGICDVCTGRNASDDPSASDFEMYGRKVRSVLRDEALPLGEILEAFALKRRETVARVIAYLLDEGELEENEEGKIFTKN